MPSGGFHVHDGRGRPLHACSQHGKRPGNWELWAARSGAESSLTNAALDRTLVFGSIILVGVFGGAAWLFTTLALRPSPECSARRGR